MEETGSLWLQAGPGAGSGPGPGPGGGEKSGDVSSGLNQHQLLLEESDWMTGLVISPADESNLV